MIKILPYEKFKTLFLERFLCNPAGKNPFNEMKSARGDKVPVDATNFANYRAKNLGDLFSIRNIEKKNRPSSLILSLIDWGAFLQQSTTLNSFYL